jgi:hypothetical protein
MEEEEDWTVRRLIWTVIYIAFEWNLVSCVDRRSFLQRSHLVSVYEARTMES